MRAVNRLLMLVLAALIGAVLVKVALWEQAGLRAAEEAAIAALPTETPAPTPTPDSALLGKGRSGQGDLEAPAERGELLFLSPADPALSRQVEGAAGDGLYPPGELRLRPWL